MTEINTIKCDGPGCTNERDKMTFGGMPYTQLIIPSKTVRVQHFCCVKCLVLYADLLVRDEKRRQVENVETELDKING